MKYQGEVETRFNGKTHTGYKVFSFRMNEYELETIAWLIDMHDSRKCMLSEQGKEFQLRLRGLRHGIKQAKKAMEEDGE